MGTSLRWQKNVSLIGLCLIFGTLGLFVFQNCSNVRLQTATHEIQSSAAQISDSRAALPLPKVNSGEKRVVFFVDSSRSMVNGNCLDSIDASVSGNVVPCDGATGGVASGADSDRKRFFVARQWLNEILEIYSQKPEEIQKFKILVVPFTGGLAQSSLESLIADLEGFKRFSSIADALKAIDRLESIQRRFYGDTNVLDVKIAGMTPSQMKNQMGTSVPAPKINSTINIVHDEIRALAQDPGARFEYVFFSDGVPKPRASHVVATAMDIWSGLITYIRGGCLVASDLPTCEATRGETPCFNCDQWDMIPQSHNTCGQDKSCQTAVANTCNGTNDVTTCSAECISSLNQFQGTDAYTSFFDTINSRWGNPLDNTQLKIFQALLGLKLEHEKAPDVSYRFSFLRLDTLTPSEYATPLTELAPDVNWLVKAKTLIAGVHRHSVLLAPKAPFALFPGLSKNNSYRLAAITALNLSTRINRNGVLDLDSDSDGLFDSEEEHLNPETFDPHRARTNGTCLDSIVYRLGGCLSVGCDPLLDADHDGLNQCEEKTLGISDEDFDTDDDGIPDGLELVFDYNPAVSDLNQYFGGLSVSNVERWRMGLPNFVNPANVSAENLIHSSVKVIRPHDSNPQTHASSLPAEYTYQVSGLRLGHSQGATAGATFFASPTHTPQSAVINPILGQGLLADYNRIILIGKVVSQQNPGEVYWVGKVLTQPYQILGTSYPLPFDQLVDLDTVDPQREGP